MGATAIGRTIHRPASAARMNAPATRRVESSGRRSDRIGASVGAATVFWPPMEEPKVVIVMPAYNAARTLERTYADIPHDIVSRIILVDDVSRDETVQIARQLGLDVIVH